ncbi:MAG: hypothetical protein HY758_08270, partial [Nitrospirae bacterium]|nr:hypothetical protein [Nitrospirota bacterium]
APDTGDIPGKKDIFFQGKLRRMYLAKNAQVYEEKGPNALSLWIKLNPGSALIENGSETKNTFGVWTYHWLFGDEKVGGPSNNSLATDSMMHGYSNFLFNKKAAGKWVKAVLTPSAFQVRRYYYHFYAARGTTDDLEFFPSLRQIQFHINSDIKAEEEIRVDQIKLIYIEPTAIFEKQFYTDRISKDAGDVVVPVVIGNPTDRTRKYRVFISSFLGVNREDLYAAHTLTDSFEPPRMMQADSGGDGGMGAVELTDEKGAEVIGKEIMISAKGIWKGKLVHHIKAEMLGRNRITYSQGHEFGSRRDTLTTSVVVWDPFDETVGAMDYIEVLPSNADDANHHSPPGFPEQKRPPLGWRSEDIPINQAGGYFVSVIQLTD